MIDFTLVQLLTWTLQKSKLSHSSTGYRQLTHSSDSDWLCLRIGCHGFYTLWQDGNNKTGFAAWVCNMGWHPRPFTKPLIMPSLSFVCAKSRSVSSESSLGEFRVSWAREPREVRRARVSKVSSMFIVQCFYSNLLHLSFNLNLNFPEVVIMLKTLIGSSFRSLVSSRLVDLIKVFWKIIKIIKHWLYR